MLKQYYDLLAHHYTSETLVFEPPTNTPINTFLCFKQLSFIFIKSDVSSSLLGGSLLSVFVFEMCDLNCLRSKL